MADKFNKSRQAMANMLMQQGMASQPTTGYGGLAKVLQMGLGGYFSGQEQANLQADEEAKKQSLASYLSGKSDLGSLAEYYPEQALSLQTAQKNKEAAQIDALAKEQRARKFAMEQQQRSQEFSEGQKNRVLTPEQLQQQIAIASAKAETTARNKPMNKDQADAAGFADRIVSSMDTIGNFASSGMDMKQKLYSQIPGAGNYLVSPEFQQFDQAQRDFINATLRRESGAAIAASEFENANKQYLPQPGDSEAVIEQKARNRETVLNSMRRSAGARYKPPVKENVFAGAMDAAADFAASIPGLPQGSKFLGFE